MKPYRLLVRPTPKAPLAFYDDYADLIGATKAAGMFHRGQIAVQTEIWKGQTLVKRWESYSWKHRDELPVYRVSAGLDVMGGEYFTDFAQAVEYATSLLCCREAVSAVVWAYGEEAAKPALIAVYTAHLIPGLPLQIEEKITDCTGTVHTAMLQVNTAA